MTRSFFRLLDRETQLTASPRAWLRLSAVVALLAIVAVGALDSIWPRMAAAQAGGGLSATITADPATAAVGQQVFFAYTVPPSPTSAATPGLTTSTIDFGDGQTVNGGGVAAGGTIVGSTVHAYTAPGAYTVTLSALAPDGETGVATVTVNVHDAPPPPTVQLTASSTTVQAGQSVSFTYSVAAAAGDDITSIVLSYGDGSVAPLTSPSDTVSHVYTNAGTYVVLLVATDSSGQPGAASVAVHVTSGG